MTAQHQVRITTSTGAQYTSLPAPGSAADIGKALNHVLESADADSTLTFPTPEGSVTVRTRIVEVLELVDVPVEPAALADCGDQA